jgi:hypothetical protein
MIRRTTSRILMSGAFVVSVMIGADAIAQTTPLPSVHGVTPQTQPKTAQSHPGEHHPACQRIISECKNLGFIQGQWKKDNGLWKDCFDPVVRGGTATRDGKPITVPVSSSDVQACRAASEGHHK